MRWLWRKLKFYDVFVETLDEREATIRQLRIELNKAKGASHE